MNVGIESDYLTCWDQPNKEVEIGIDGELKSKWVSD